MQTDERRLNIVVADHEFGSTLNLSLLHTTDRSVQMAGVLVAARGDLLLSSLLEVSGDAPFGDNYFEDDGVFEALSDGESEIFRYEFGSQETASPFTLWHASIISETTRLRYQSFALEDPFPLIILPIAGAVVGVQWLWRRHAKQDQSAGQMMKDSVDQARAEGRSTRLVQESESEVSFMGLKYKAKSKFQADIGERPAT
jgi:hypothetical protein